MNVWNIYHSDGSFLTDANGEQVRTSDIELSEAWMSECFVSVSFKHNAPIDFQIGDYLIYRNERYELNYEPGKDKSSSLNSYGDGFVYDSVKFNALQDELSRTEFLDVVLHDNELHYTALSKFSFYVETIDDLLDRIQANLDEQIGKGKWKIFSRSIEKSRQRGCTDEEWKLAYGEKTPDDIVIDSKSLTVDTQTCWDALALVQSEFNVNFIIRGRNIYVGTIGVVADHIFKYGLGEGLYEIEQNADSEQQVITRLRAYGSEKNLPSHYYTDLDKSIVAYVLSILGNRETEGDEVYTYVVLDLAFYKSYFTKPIDGQEYEVYITTDSVTNIRATIKEGAGSTNKGKCVLGVYWYEGGNPYNSTSKEDALKFINSVKVGDKIQLVSGINKDNIHAPNVEYADYLPNNMAVNRLMLPGFPKQSLSDFYNTLTEDEKKYVNPTGKAHKFSNDKYRPYVDSLNIDKIGLRSSSQFFDTDDKTNGVIEIYPTIEEMVVNGVRVDEINEGVTPDDDGRFEDNATVANVDIYLSPSIDFDINDQREDDFSISMKDGMCGGRTFKVASVLKGNGRWRLRIERVKDEALELWFPYKDYPIRKGDHFVLTGIKLPDSYVRAASLKLLKYAIALLDKNDYTRYVYQPKVDEIFMARQHDMAMSDTTGLVKSLHDTLKAGDLLRFEDTDLGIDAEITIDQLVIKEAEGQIPTYEITLREDKEVGTIQKIQNQISSLLSGNAGTGGGLTIAQLRAEIASEGGKRFLSKLKDDTSQGLITFLKGLKAQDVIKAINGMSLGYGENYVNGNGDAKLSDVIVDRIHDKNSTPSDRTIIGAQGFDLYMGDDGKSHLYVDYLTARTRMFASSVEIRKVSYSGGTTIFSNAGSQIAKVSYIYDAAKEKVIAYKCYAVADDGTTKTMNWWHVGMMALCQTFNVKAGESEALANRYYWRMVVGVGQEKLDGKLYDYVILSNIKEFQGNLLTIPTYSDKTLANEQKKKLVWGNVMVEVTMDEGMQTLASLFAEQEGTDVDDNGNKIADRVFYGYDGEKPDAPAPYDVIVQVGDQIQWKKFGNVIKLSTSTEDSAKDKDNDNAPAITMYHKLGAPHYTGSLDANDNKIVNPYQWKIITTIISPEKVMHNTDNFQLFQGTPDNIIDPITIMYDIVPSVAYYTRHPSTQTTTPTDITFSLRKRTGNKVETLTDAQIYAEYTLLNGSSATKILPNKALSDIGNLYQITSVKLKSTIKEADHEDIVVTLDLPVLTDGVKGDQGAAGKDGTNGIDGKDGKTPAVVSTTYQYAITATSAKPADSEWKPVMPDPSQYEGQFFWTKTTTTWSTGDKTDTFSCAYIGTDGANGTSVTIKGTLGSISELPTTVTAGDGYIIDGFLWEYTGTDTEDANNHNGYTNVGKIKGEDGKNATQYYIHTAWMKASDGTGFTVANPNGDAYPYVGTLVDANEKDSTNWRDYKWTYVKGDTGSKGDKGDKGDQGLPGVDGAPGANGKDGEDAINIVVKDIPMVFDTEDNGLVVDGAERYASIYVYKKKENISSLVENVAVNSTENCECEVAYNSVRKCLRAKVYKVAKEDITVDGATTQISKTAGYATIRFSYNGVMFYQQVQFVVNVSKFNSSVIQTTKKFEQKYTEVSNQVGTLNTNLNNLGSDLSNLQDDVDSLDKQVTAIPIRSDQDLTTFESKITQTAREISLSLTEKATSRRNLLVNSDFARDSGISIFLQGQTITERLSGYEGSNCIHLFASYSKSYPILRWEGGNAKCNNIPIVAGKKYTISCWAKVTDVTAPLYVKVFGQSALTGNDATSINAIGTLLDKPVTLKAANTWQVVSVTFDASGGYSYCSVRLFYRLKTNGRIDGYVCRPMLEQSDSYNGWTLSDEDYDYRGGNMLDNTRYLNTGGNLSGVGRVVANAMDGCSMSEATVSQGGSGTLMRFDKVSVKANNDYTLSFLIRSYNSSSKTNVVCTLNLVTNAKFAECSSGSVSSYTSANGNSTTSGYIELGNIPTEWTKVWYHFSPKNDYTNQAIAIQIYGRNGEGTLQVCQPKLEAGLMNTPWTEATEDVANKDALKRTGIDIERGKIILDADNTVITGDLHLRGILVENYEDLSANNDLFIVCDMKAHKSVTVSHSRVILPMLDTHTIKDYNDKEYAVNGLKEAGVKLTIASKYNSYVAKWAQTIPSLFESYKNFDNRGLMKTYHNYASVVFADPRIADKGNYKIVDGIDTLVPTILPEGGGGYAATGYEGGVFVCNGRRGRALVLMPGQTLHLTSAIEYVNEKQVLIWYVDNSSDFTPLTKEVCFYSWDGHTYDHGFRSNGGNAFPMEVSGSSGSEYEDAIFGTKILDETNLNGSLHAYWGGFITGYSD